MGIRFIHCRERWFVRVSSTRSKKKKADTLSRFREITSSEFF